MKKIVPFFAAIVVFAIALFMMRPEPSASVIVAAERLPSGHTITEADLQVRSLPGSLVPQGALTNLADAVGKTLSMDRTVGDFIFANNLGGESLELAPDERAVAIHVTDSAGMAGLLKAGDTVGLTATFGGQSFSEEGQTGSFAKNLAGGLRVLYISPEFKSIDPGVVAASNGSSGGFAASGSTPAQRSKEGVVVLAIPISMQTIAYDFTAYGSESETRQVYLIDLLPALDQSKEVALSLVLEPKNPTAYTSSGIFLPDLVIPPGPSPTPTNAVRGAGSASGVVSTPVPPAAVPTKTP